MDKERLATAINAIAAFFSEEEQTKMYEEDWRFNGQTFYERVEGYVLGAIESLEDEMECPDDKNTELD